MPRAVSVDEYLATTYDPDCDYVDGEVLERNRGEVDHSRLQMLIGGYFLSREEFWGITALPEVRVQVTAKRFRVWGVNPRSRLGFIYTSDGMHEAKDGILRVEGTPIEVPLASLG
jgi:hypothetical protein